MDCPHRISWAALFAGLILISSNVSRGVTLDSTMFNHKYEGEIYNNPGIPNYTEEVQAGNNAAPFSIASDVANTADGYALQMQSDVAHYADLYSNASAGEWVNGPNPVSDGVGWTIEFRVKIGVDAPEGPAGAFQIFAKESGNTATTKRVNIAVGGSSLTRIDASTLKPITADVNTDDFHVFRIAEAANSSNITIWRDGVQVYSDVSTTAIINTAPQLWFGDGGATIGGPTVLIDYVRWDSTGAYEPIPPPVLLPGDFNGDGKVDGGDFAAWQGHFPLSSDATLVDGDADGDGDVDGADFIVWQTNQSTTQASVNTVPEPNSFYLFGTAITCLAWSRRWRSR